MNFSSLLKKIIGVSIITSTIVLFTNLTLSLIMSHGDFGVYTYYQSLFILLINIIPFGTTMAVIVFMFKMEEKKFTSILSNGLFSLTPSVFIILVVILFCLPLSIVANKKELFIILTLSLSCSLSIIVIAYYRARQKILIYRRLFIGYTFLVSVTTIVSYLITSSVERTFLILSISTSLLAITYIYFLRKELPIGISSLNLKKDYFWSLKYGLPVVLSSSAMSFLIVGDKIVLANTTDVISLSSYSAAAFLSSTTLFLVNNFASAWGGYLSKDLATKPKEIACSEFKTNLKRFMLIIPITSLVLLLQFSFYFLFYKNKFPDMYSVIFFLTCAYITFGASKYFMGYMNYFTRNKAVFISSLFGILVTFTIFFLFIDIYDFKLMAFSVFIGMLSQLCFCSIYTIRLMDNYRNNHATR